jgi:hypothetical protein
LQTQDFNLRNKKIPNTVNEINDFKLIFKERKADKKWSFYRVTMVFTSSCV